jgi:hypothetical protein
MTAVEHERGASASQAGAASRVIPFPLTAARQSASPELALVDPMLRERLLATLHDPGSFRPATRDAGSAAAAGSAPVIRLGAVPPLAQPPAARDRRRLASTLAISAVAFATVGFVAARYGPGSASEGTPLAPQTQATRAASPAPRPAARVNPQAKRTSPSPPAAPAAKPQAEPKASAPHATPTTPARSEKTPSQPSPGRTFAWAPAEGAQVYEVQFFRGTRRVFAGRVHGTRLELPASWNYEGTRESLARGSYRWYVWPIRRGQRARQPVVQATFAVARDS